MALPVVDLAVVLGGEHGGAQRALLKARNIQGFLAEELIIRTTLHLLVRWVRWKSSIPAYMSSIGPIDTTAKPQLHEKAKHFMNSSKVGRQPPH